jgi:hypothetical protein
MKDEEGRRKKECQKKNRGQRDRETERQRD